MLETLRHGVYNKSVTEEWTGERTFDADSCLTGVIVIDRYE